jgi:hypothetical protein
MLLVLGILFALAYVFILRAPPTVPAPELKETQGTYTWESAVAGGAGSGSGDFAALAGGDAWGTFSPDAGGTPRLVRSAYAAGSRTESTLGPGAGGVAVTFTRHTGAWPPSWLVATRSPLDYQGLAAIVRSAVEDGDAAVGVKPFEQDGRKVWRAALTLDGITRELVVDQDSGLVTWCTDGESTFIAAVDWAPSPLPATAPPLTGPVDSPAVSTADPDYTYWTSPAQAGRASGFVPLASGLAPDGYSQAAVATAPLTGAAADWLAAASLPAGGSAGTATGPPLQIAELYVRGLGRFEVRQLDDTAVAGALDRAFQEIGATALSFQRTALQYGVFAGRTAATWYAADGPTLLVGDGRRVVYVTGALTRQELLSLAEGFRPLPAGTTKSPAASGVSPVSTSPSSSPSGP